MDMKIWCVINGHKWKGCLCERCGEARDEGHVWEPDASEPCKFHCRCGLHTYRHDWVNGFCRRCLIPALPPAPRSIYDSAMTAHMSRSAFSSEPEAEADLGTGMLGTHAPGGTMPAQEVKPEVPLASPLRRAPDSAADSPRA
jgi:hypothetical protein